jgi:uncharacterized protein YjdB
MERQTSRRYFFIIYFVCMVFSSACGSDNNGGTILTSMTITPINPVISMGAKQQFTAVGLYSDTTAKDLTSQVTWTSSDPNKVIVDSSGIVTPVAAGTASIIATSDTISANTTLTITAATLKSIQVMPINITISIGANQQFTALGIYSDNTTKDLTSQVTWTTSDQTIATVSSTGLVAGVETGTTNIIATSDTISAHTPLTITAATLTSIQVTPIDTTLSMDMDQQFTAVGLYSDGTVVDLTTQVTWTSSDPNIAVITASGQVTGLATGTVQILATSGAITGTTTVNLTPDALQSITLSNIDNYGEWIVQVGQHITFIATGHYSDGRTNNITTQVTWSSSDPAKASVSLAGEVIIQENINDQVEILATFGTVTATQILTIVHS